MTVHNIWSFWVIKLPAFNLQQIIQTVTASQKLKKLYFFLVNYVMKSPEQRVFSPPAPGVVSQPSTGLTALHLLLWKGENLQFNSLGCTIMDWSCCYCAEETWTLIPWSFVFEDFEKKIGTEYLDHKVPQSMIQRENQISQQRGVDLSAYGTESWFYFSLQILQIWRSWNYIPKNSNGWHIQHSSGRNPIGKQCFGKALFSL